MTITVTEVASHRNGIRGEPFHVCFFTDADIESKANNIDGKMVGVVFSEPGYCAVLNVDLLHKGNIAFAMGNSWRGDYFEDDLRRIIKEWEKDRK